MSFDNIIKRTSDYYSAKIAQFGPTAKGVDWNSPETQSARFEQLLKICDLEYPFTLNDFGCGYGALADHLIARNYKFKSYTGYDISQAMLEQARQLHSHCQSCKFSSEESDLVVADYTVASGIFNVKLESVKEDWEKYLLNVLGKINVLSLRGFAFNVLTAYSDPEYMRADLYYAEPAWLFDYCKKNFSKYVSLLHDYPLYEFTILVRK